MYLKYSFKVSFINTQLNYLYNNINICNESTKYIFIYMHLLYIYIIYKLVMYINIPYVTILYFMCYVTYS